MINQGTVKFFNADKGYGFIASDEGGPDTFVHISALERSGLQDLQREQRISFEVETDRQGKPAAFNIQSI
jgi:cold shock protein